MEVFELRLCKKNAVGSQYLLKFSLYFKETIKT